MTTTTLQRIHLLAEAAANPLHKPLAQTVRQLLDAAKTAAEKAHAVTGVLMKFSQAEQERVLAAIEGLGK